MNKWTWNPKAYVKCSRCEVMRPPKDCRLDTDDWVHDPQPVICIDRATCDRLKAARLELEAVKP